MSRAHRPTPGRRAHPDDVAVAGRVSIEELTAIVDKFEASASGRDRDVWLFKLTAALAGMPEIAVMRKGHMYTYLDGKLVERTVISLGGS